MNTFAIPFINLICLEATEGVDLQFGMLSKSLKALLFF